MARVDGTHTRTGLSPIVMGATALAWVSAVIVMGILSFFLSENKNQGSHVIYEEVIAVLTVIILPAVFVLAKKPGFGMLMTIIFSHLWIVAVAFTASDWSNKSAGALRHTVEAFSFVAFFCLLAIVLYEWHVGHRGSRTRSTV